MTGEEEISLADVTQDIVVWWGEGDDPTSRDESNYLAASIPRASLVSTQMLATCW